MSKQAPFGSWKSPITAELLSRSQASYSDPRLIDGSIYWLESRPWEQGRSVVVQYIDGVTRDLVPDSFNVRSRVHEYGGLCWTVSRGVLLFVNSSDQQVYMSSLNSDGPPTQLTFEESCRFADLIVDHVHSRVIAVAERHAQHHEPENLLVSIPLDAEESGKPAAHTPLASGDDFYAYPRLSPSGDSLVWLSWNHPNMPWDSSQLWGSNFNSDGTLSSPELIAGKNDESLFQPNWSPDGQLYFVSDRNDWWNIYRQVIDEKSEAVTSMEAEFGLPLWQFGMSTYGFLNNDEALACFSREGNWNLALVDLKQKQCQEVDTPWNWISSICCENDHALFLAGSPDQPPQVVLYQHNLKKFEVLSGSSNSSSLLQDYISEPVPVSFPTCDDEIAHGFYYSPHNPEYSGPASAEPPLIVLCHGGPTGATSAAFNLKVQFWTSRGFAVFDVNYRGSTGYGRNYRRRLYDNWGIVDVEDACAAAEYATQMGWVNPQQRIIRGSSAGGYSVLAALTFKETFDAGCSVYGIGDLEILAKETHKFESRYGDSLIGPYPEEKQKYHDRSPLNFVDNISCPVIFFQGMKDKVVPPNQAQMMVDAVAGKGLPVAHITYKNEAHGFRDAGTISHSLNSELAFYGELFGFQTDSNITDLEILNRGVNSG